MISFQTMASRNISETTRAELQRKYDEQERAAYRAVLAQWSHPVSYELRGNVEVLDDTLQRCDKELMVTKIVNGYLRGEVRETALENIKLKHDLSELERQKQAPNIVRLQAENEAYRAQIQALEKQLVSNTEKMCKIQKLIRPDSNALAEELAEKDATITRMDNQIHALLKENEELRKGPAKGSSKKLDQMDLDSLFASSSGDAKSASAKTIDPRLQAMLDSNTMPENFVDHLQFLGTLKNSDYLVDTYCQGEWLEICRKHNLAIQTPQGDTVTWSGSDQLHAFIDGSIWD